MAMPWSRAKAKAAAIRADTTGAAHAKLTELFDACFRIQREACEAAGRHIPMIVENVRGAEPWVGRARWRWGSFLLWGDVPALMPPIVRAHKIPGFRFDGSGRSFQSASVADMKSDGGSWFGDYATMAEGVKQRGSGREWFAGDGKISRMTSSKSPARKAASAMIAKIPEALARHELVKIKFADFKEDKKTLAPLLAEKTSSHLVMRVGNVMVLHRPKPVAGASESISRIKANGNVRGTKSNRKPRQTREKLF